MATLLRLATAAVWPRRLSGGCVRAAPSARKTTSLTHMLPSRRRFTFVTAAGNNVG